MDWSEKIRITFCEMFSAAIAKNVSADDCELRRERVATNPCLHSDVIFVGSAVPLTEIQRSVCFTAAHNCKMTKTLRQLLTFFNSVGLACVPK